MRSGLEPGRHKIIKEWPPKSLALQAFLGQPGRTEMNCGRKLWRTLALTFLIPVLTGFAASRTLQIQDSIGRSWEQEPINWEISLKPGEFKGGPVLVQRDGKAIPAQADIVEKHSDGSAKIATVRFLIDKLDTNATTKLTADLGKEGPS